MMKLTKKQILDINTNVRCDYGKLMAVFRLSNEELIDILQMKSKKDFDGIKQILTQHEELCLHPATFEILDNDTDPIFIGGRKKCELLIYATHARKPSTIIAALIGNCLYEFEPRFGCQKFFVGGCSHKPFVIRGWLNEDVKPVSLRIK